MALPEFLSGSYQRYKEDTTTFTTWLTQAAAAVGWKPPKKPSQSAAEPAAIPQPSVAKPAPSGRLKGKARKAAKASATPTNNSSNNTPAKGPAVRYTLSTQDLLAQAEAVAQATGTKGHVRMPDAVQQLLKRAINARRRCADWFETAKVEARKSNEGHRHFIDALQRALDLLSWRKQDAKGVEERTHDSEDAVLELQNRFEALDVEYVDEQFAATPAAASKSGGGAKNEVYELEADPAWEDAFICYCFFQDLHSIQNTLKDAWKNYADGKLDLVSATVATTAALELVQHAEKDLLDANPRLHTYGRPYDDIAMAVFYVETLRNGRDPEEFIKSPESLEVTDLEDFIYLPTARVLMKMAQLAKNMDKINWPLPVPQMRFSYIARPELLELPKYKKLEEEDRTLTQLLHEAALVHEMKKYPGIASTKVLPDFQDEFSKSLDVLWTKGEIRIHNVFASRIILYIVDITCKQRRSHMDLLTMGEHVKRDMEFQIYPDGSMGTGDTRWLARDNNTLMDIYQLVEKHIPYLPVGEFKKMMMEANKDNLQHRFDLDDAPPEVREAIKESLRRKGMDFAADGPSEAHKRNAKRLNLGPIGPAPEADFAVTHNPLFCGMMALQLDVFTEDAGVALSNHHLSIFATAHLYNALRQLGLIQIIWPELERVMELHAGPIFADDVPDTPEKFHARMALRLGSTGHTRKPEKLQKYKLQVTPTSAALREYLDGKKSIEGVIKQEVFESQLQEHMLAVNSSTNAATNRSKSQKKSNNNNRSLRLRHWTPLQSVQALQSFMPAALPNMTINYIALTKTCNALMRTVRQRIQNELGIGYPSMAQLGDSNDYGFVFMTLKILEETKTEAQAFQKMKKKGEAKAFEGGMQLRSAGATMEELYRSRVIVS